MATILRCTARLTALLGIARRDPYDVSQEPDADEWYANLIWIDGRKCVLAAHARTLFAVVALDVRKADLTPIGAFLAEHVAAAFELEDLEASPLANIDFDTVVIAPTASKSILGSMNEMAFMVRHSVAVSGGLANANQDDLGRALRRMPMIGTLGGAAPIDLVREL